MTITNNQPTHPTEPNMPENTQQKTTTNVHTGILKFGGMTRDAAVRSRKEVKAGSANFFKFKDGSTSVVRFLPPPVGAQVPWVICHQHFLKNWAGGKRPLVFNCPLKAGESACPACEREEQLRGSGNPADIAKANDMAPRARVYANIIDRKDEETGVQIVAFGSMILEQLVEFIEDEEVYGRDYTHPFEGDDITVKRTTDNDRTTYKVNIRGGDHPRLAVTDEQMIKWIETAPNLNRYTEVLPYEVIQNAAHALRVEAQGGTQAPRMQRAVADAPTNKPTNKPTDDASAQPSAGLDDGVGMESAAGSGAGEVDNSGF